MKKGAIAFVLILIIGSLALPGHIKAEEELMVPIGEIKTTPECKKKINWTKAEMALNEIGKECVKKSWLQENKEKILETLRKEEDKFNKTLEKGMKEFNRIVENQDTKKASEISGKDSFLLYQSYGFPLEMTKELAKEKGLKVDEKGFESYRGS